MNGGEADEPQGADARTTPPRACPLPAQPRTRDNRLTTRPKAAGLTSWRGAALTVVERSGIVHRGEAHHARGDKRAVRRFTSRQRSAFLRALATVDNDVPAVFVTLTFPTWAAPEGRGWMEPWNRWRMRLARRFPSAAGFYKRELTKAGVVHLHAIVYGVSRADLRAFVPAAWADSVHAPERDLRERVGTQVSLVHKADGARRYACKYVSKAIIGDVGDDPSGPWWGTFNDAAIPRVQPVAVAVPDDVAVRLIRAGRKLINAQRRRRGYRPLRWHRFNRLTLLGDPDAWTRLAVLYGARLPAGVPG